ncbi:putative DNA-binding protein (UPF0251 family) [Neobacillus sp. B4I6]|uniref:helix-turn-helix domain-containing protein n=1 Tax=Neobacillus sp. B4I6 TaxID=3373925 RepID=UPI003D20B7AC
MYLTDDLTDEHYLIAEKNGISRKNVKQRFWDYGWSIEKAITKPIPVKTSEWENWKETAIQNRVSNALYTQRVKNGMTPEQAVMMPVGSRGVRPQKKFKAEQIAEIRELCQNKKCTQIQLARKYGVSRTTIWNIVNKKTVYANV